MNVFSKILCLIAMTCLLLGAIGGAKAYADGGYIGFASMKTPHVKDPETNVILREMTRMLFDMKYSSFQRVAVAEHILDLKPRTLTLPGEEGTRIPLRPHPKNEKAIERFHDEFDQRGEEFLKAVCAVNDARAIVFDQCLDTPKQLQMFGMDPNGSLTIELEAFYRDSNTMAFKFVKINKSLMRNYPKLMDVIQNKVVNLMKDLMLNQQALVSSGTPSKNAPSDQKSTVSSSTPSDSAASSEW